VVLGAAQEVLVLDVAGGLSVTLPVERARELRPLLSKADLRRVQETLREDHQLSEDDWPKRRKNTEAKLKEAIRWDSRRSCVTAHAASRD
jgi:RNA polymerase-interacting CarD/CdnL/TRCF family regulator